MRPPLLIIAMLVVFSFSCAKKKYPKSITENEPEFLMKATIDGVEQDFTAGIDGYRVLPVLRQDSNNVYNFISEFSPSTCQSGCTNSLRIQINDYRTRPAGATAIVDSALAPGYYSYLTDVNGAAYTVSFAGLYNKTAASYKWDFGDGTSSTEAQPRHTYKRAGKYTVSLQVGGTNSCVGAVSNVITVGAHNPLNATVATNSLAAGQTQFAANVSGGKAPYSYLWNFGDGSTDVVAFPKHSYQFTGGYAVSLRVIDANNDTTVVAYNYVTESDKSSCAANFNMGAISATPYSLALSKIIVQWTNTNGEIYTSLNAGQPSASNFQLVSVEDYDGGPQMKKVHVRFNCTVYSGNKQITIRNADVVLALAYN